MNVTSSTHWRRSGLPWPVVLLPLVAFGLSGCEPPPEFCRNGEDDDRDGDVDCHDSDCSDRVHCRGAFVPAEAVTESYSWPGARDPSNEIAKSWHGDLDGDGLADFGGSATSGEGITDEHTTETDSHVTVYLSSQRDGGGSYDFADAAIRITVPLDSFFEPSATTDCDIDGDGLEDLVAVDTYGVIFGWSQPSSPMLRIVYGSPSLGLESDIPVRTILLPSDVSVLAEVVCVGDVDGDGAGDLVLAGPSQMVRLLPSGRLVTASTLEEAQSRQWNVVVERIEPAGDLDGDGFDDILLFGEPWSHDELEAADVWGLVVVLPGSEDLAAVQVEPRSIDDEVRGPVRVYIEARKVLPETRFDVFFADLDSDGVAELLARVPGDYSWEFLAGEVIAPLDGDAVLSESDTLAGFWDYDPADPEQRRDAGGGTPVDVSDVDGDGCMDIVGKAGLLIPPGTAEPFMPEGMFGGLGVWFGDGTVESFDRLPDQVDVIARSLDWLPQLTASRDGSEELDIALMGGTEISVLPGRAVVEAAGR